MVTERRRAVHTIKRLEARLDQEDLDIKHALQADGADFVVSERYTNIRRAGV